MAGNLAGFKTDIQITCEKKNNTNIKNS